MSKRLSGLRHVALAAFVAASSVPPALGLGVPSAAAQGLPIFWSISDSSVREGGAEQFTITLTGALNRPDVSINWTTVANTAVADVDYVTSSGTITIPSGSAQASFSVRTLQDTQSEPRESFYVELSGATQGSIQDGIGEGFIDDDDPTPRLAIQSTSVREGDSGSVNAVFNVTLSNPSTQLIGVHYHTVSQTATGGQSGTAGVDYQNTTGRLTWLPGNNATQQILVPVSGDPNHEDDETFRVEVDSATPSVIIATGVATATIDNDDAPPLVSVGDVSTLEMNAGTHIVNVPATLSAATNADVTFKFDTANGSARAALDYVTIKGGSVTIPAGSTGVVIPVLVIGDMAIEPDEEFSIVIYDAVNAGLGDAVADVTILRDDP